VSVLNSSFFHLRFEIGSPLGRRLLTGLLGWEARFRFWSGASWDADDQGQLNNTSAAIWLVFMYVSPVVGAFRKGAMT
jgi:hypothetical protein